MFAIRRGLFYAIALFTAAHFLPACNNSAPTNTEERTDRIVGGVNFTRLFAPPTAAEIAQIENEWLARQIQVTDFREEMSIQTSLGRTPATLRVVSHVVDGNRHYGAILSPNGAAPGSLPIMMYTHGGDGGFSLNEFQLIATFNDDVIDRFVYVAPAFRSEPLRTESAVYLSEGEPSPWDRDVDDALALLEATLANTPAADPQRIGALGFSRGAAVAMLMAIRDPRIDLVIEFFGPTDFFGEFVQSVTEETLLGMPRDLPGVDYLNTTILLPLKNGELSIEQVRLEILRRSPVYFAGRLGQLQVHHGTADSIVPVAEAERLIEVMTQLGRGAPDFVAYIYPGGQHNPFTLAGSIERAKNFLARLLENGEIRASVDALD